MENVLDAFSLLNNFSFNPEPRKPRTLPETKPVPFVLQDTRKRLSVGADKAMVDACLIVHDLSDYRRTEKSLLLLPKITAVIDYLIIDREELSRCRPTL